MSGAWASAMRAGRPALLRLAGVSATTLERSPKLARDTVGWIGLVTVFFACCMWAVVLFFRTIPTPEAYDVPSDPDQRKRYDAFGEDFRRVPPDVDPTDWRQSHAYAGAGARRGGHTMPSSSACVMIMPPTRRVDTPHDVVHACSILLFTSVN